MPQVFVYGFLNHNIGWFLLAAVVVAAIGAISLASRRARENGISNRIFAAAAIVAVSTLVVYASAMILTSLAISPS